MRAEQKPQLMNGRLVLVTKTATLYPHTGQGAVPSSGIAGLSSRGSFGFSLALCGCEAVFSGSEVLRPIRRNRLKVGLSLSMWESPLCAEIAELARGL